MPCAEQSFTQIAKTQFEKFSGFQICENDKQTLHRLYLINYEIYPFILGIFITDGSLQVSKKLQGLVNARDFEQWKHIEIIVLAICWRLSAFKGASHEKSIFLKIHSFFSFKFFQGHNWLTAWRHDVYTQLAEDVTRRESLLFSYTELSYLGEHSEVSQARSLHACWTRMLYHDRIETIENSQRTNSVKTLKIFNVYSSLEL